MLYAQNCHLCFTVLPLKSDTKLIHKLPKFSYVITCYSIIILVIYFVNDNNAIILENMSTVLPVDIFLQNLHNCYHVHLEYCLRAYLLHPLIIAIYWLFMHYASKFPIILFNNITSCYSQNYASTLGSCLTAVATWSNCVWRLWNSFDAYKQTTLIKKAVPCLHIQISLFYWLNL